MAPQRKTRGCLTANRQDDRAPVVNEAPKPRKKVPSARVLQRQQRNEANVEEWVYRFLGNLAAIEQNKQKPRKRTTTFRLNNRSKKRQVSKTEALRRLRSPTPYSWDRTTPRSVADALRQPMDSDYDEDKDTSPPITLPMVTVNPRARRAEDVVPPLPDAPVSDAMESQDDENRTLLQKINRYIKAGIAEAKRRGKRYVRKALSFAIEMGYLVPADSEGKLLRVSAALVNAPRTDAAKPTKKQRQAATTSSGRVRRRTTRKRPPQRGSSTRQVRRRRSKHPRVKRQGQGDDVYDEVAATKRRDSGSDEEDGRNSRPSGAADDELEKSSDNASKTAEGRSSRSPSVRSGGRQSGTIPETMSSRLDSDEAMDCKPPLSLLQQQPQQFSPIISAVRPRTSASQRSGHQRNFDEGQR